MDKMDPPTESDLLTIWEFNQAKFTPIVPLNEVGIRMPLLAFWRKQGFLPFIEKGKWAKVSFMQFLWIAVLEAVHNLGLPLSRMKDLTDYFIIRAYHDDLPKRNLEHNREVLEKKARLTPLTTEELQLLFDIKQRLKSEVLLYSDKWDVNYFSNLVTRVIHEEKEGGILIYPDFIAEYVQRSYWVFPARQVNLEIPHVTIPLTGFLRPFIKNDSLASFEKFHEFLNKDEEAVLKALRTNTIKSINITKASGGSFRIDTTKTGQLTSEEASEIKRILGVKNYESITLDTNDTKTLRFKRVTKSLYR